MTRIASLSFAVVLAATVPVLAQPAQPAKPAQPPGKPAAPTPPPGKAPPPGPGRAELKPATPPAPGKPSLTWYGHAAFSLTTPSGKVILIDPWITNPNNPAGKDHLAAITHADLILITHGHADHVGDAVALGKKTRAKLVTTFDLGRAIVAELGYPKDQIGFETQGNFGGELKLLDGEVTIRLVPAVHSSAVARDDNTAPKDAGAPGGFVISVKGGPVVYHTGDTDVYGDMAMIGKEFKVTHMLACIGGHFTMGPAGAAEAARMIRPRNLVPMHFGTFPVLTGTVDELRKQLKKRGAGGVKVLALEIGKPVTL